jgi:hypothetical protein
MLSMSRQILMGIVGVLLCMRPASATVTVPTDFREIVADATLIIRGHVTDVRGAVFPDRGIESIVSIGVETVLKGEAVDFVSIMLPGGVVGRSRVEMVGAPKLRTGDRAVFFLNRDRNNIWQLTGLSMGIYRVRSGGPNGENVVNPPLVIGQTADAGSVRRGDPRRRPLALAEFESLVRLVIAERRTATRSSR